MRTEIIYRAIAAQLKNACMGTRLSGVKIISEELEKPIIRPSVKIVLDNCHSGLYNSIVAENSMTANIYFFAADGNRPKTDNMEMQDIIQRAFRESLTIDNELNIPIEAVNSDTTDGVLVCEFDIAYIEMLPETAAETIDKLHERVKT